MPRTKEFDQNEALDRALELFRARGFDGTSFADLTDGLGVCRQSLYDTYGDKRALYHAALRRYLEKAGESIRQLLARPGPLRKILAGCFDHIISVNCGRAGAGCMMVNSMVERAPLDPEIRALAQAYAREVEGLLISRLCAAQRKGEISRAKDPVVLARFFFHLLLGLNVATRALGERNRLRESVRAALHVLD